MSLPVLKDFNLLVTRWKAILDPIVANPLLPGVAITNISLIAATPKTIQVGLGRMQQGWFITDKQAYADVQRTQPFNENNITLEASANTTISIWCY